ncbi:JAB1/Mov34/MPN/PAD-1 ubiquitin protease-domain-containing protein [Helicostylum pulchrum]|nr:JAB1/Mov34/MPN/PAD-1 ubiquitin protease-domain-containing protein [Helicostylum pulchrum]
MLSQVNLPASLYRLILSHAYSTEKEEIIGMLIGYWETVSSNNPYISAKTVAKVEYISFLSRSDKRKDRVEIASESLHLAVEAAENFSKLAGKEMGVIGWYHSHPHITVLPSHVDIRTQLTQQMMDEKFVGIIVSCFNGGANNVEKVQITCFQSKGDVLTTTPKKVNVPLIISPVENDKYTRELYWKLPDHLHEEHKKEYTASIDCIKYDLRFKGDKPQKSLPNAMTELYNAGIYGQLTTNLIDNMILPATHTLDLKAIALDKEVLCITMLTKNYAKIIY